MNDTVNTPLFPQVGKDGILEINTNLMPAAQENGKDIFVDDKSVIPVVLVPGIMATRLVTLQGKFVWDPPAMAIGAMLDALCDYLFKGPNARAEALDSSNTRVFGPEPGTDDFIDTRGKGALYAAAYGGMMDELEEKLNALAVTGDTSWASKFKYELWGAGYNWLQSNLESAERVAKIIDVIIAHYAKSGKLNKRKQVLLITHSMGGIVSRVLSQKGLDGNIMGVLHTVQPCVGAAATYKRMRAGFEGPSSILLGRNALEVAGILAKSLAGLELLPFPEYNGGRPWLFCPEDISRGPGNTSTLALPKNKAPYTDIYTSRKWYGLIPLHNAAVVNIAYHGRWSAKPEETRSFFQKFDRLIDRVEDFHENISNAYHPFTYALWANDADNGYRTWGTVTWSHRMDNSSPGHMDDPLPGMGGYRSPDHLEDDRVGTVTHRYYQAKLKGAEDAGDGTVPARQSAAMCGPYVKKAMEFGSGQTSNSGRTPPPPEDTNVNTGFDHSDSCNYRKVRDTVFDCVVEMVNTLFEK